MEKVLNQLKLDSISDYTIFLQYWCVRERERKRESVCVDACACCVRVCAFRLISHSGVSVKFGF